MKVSDAVAQRKSIREFLDIPVSSELVKNLLIKASRAASGGNLQPWKIWVVSGNPLKDFIEDVANKIKENPMGEGTEYNIYPKNLKEPYESRRREVGRSMYEVCLLYTSPSPRDKRQSRMPWCA